MSYRKIVGLLLCGFAFATTPAIAGPLVSVSLSSPTNLSALTVGQKVEIDVSISGLIANDFIFNLNTRVLFSTSVFQAIPDSTSPSGLTAVVAPGSVFNDNANGPAKITNFNYLSSLTQGAATGIFAETPIANSGAIGLNGLYYSFILQAKSVGTGVISFDPTAGANEYASDDTNFNYSPFNSLNSLSFNVLPSGAVPEPSSIALCGIAGLCAVGYSWKNRKPRQRRLI